MNTAPRLRWDGMDRRLTNYGCGLLGLENDRRAFWQSRATLTGQRAEVPDLVDLTALAISLRKTWAMAYWWGLVTRDRMTPHAP